MRKIKKIFTNIWYKLFKGNFLNLTFAILFLLIGAIAIFLAINNWDSILIAVPGVISHDEYNELTDEKNEIISENSILLVENSDNEELLSALDASDYSGKADLYNKIIINLQEVIDNLNTMIGYGTDFSQMQLPVYVGRYVELSKELDELRLVASEISLSITQGRKDLNELNSQRGSFDLCLNKVDWNGKDSKIEEGIRSCVELIDVMVVYSETLETEYVIELTEIKSYFGVLKEQWEASADYYSALADGNYSLANDHDAIFAEKRREIENLDLDEVLGIFNTLVITPLVEEFAGINEQVSSKQNEVDTWYEENIEK